MESIIEKKSYDFALNCLKAGKKIQSEMKEYHVSQQFIKSATSIGTNVREANSGESLKDFAHKMTIALKEASESNYWCCLLRDSGLITEDEGDKLIKDSMELRRILGRIVNTTRAKIKSKES